MKKLITLIALLIVTLTSFATNYYVSNSGNDGAAGTLAAPWATIGKVNSSMGTFVAGDSILFQRGDTFTGTLNVTTNGVIFSAYGTGNKPILTGFYTVPSWTSAGTNLWSATVPSGLNNIRLLTINDAIARNGRYPNYVDGFSAWLRYSNDLAGVSPVTVNTTTTIPTNLADGELVLFKNNWNLDVMPIQSISGNNITCLNPAGLYGISVVDGNKNFGYFVQNSINALDVQNEWAYSNTSKVVTIYSTSNPSTLGIIKIPRQTNIVNLNSTNNVTLDNLDIQGCSEKAVIASGGSNQVIKNCTVRFAQGWGIDVRGSNLTIQDNLVRDIGSNGIWINSSATVTRNTIKTCGNIEGLAGLTNSGAGTQGNQNDQHIGININTGTITNGTRVVSSLNKIDSTGYAGIRYYGSDILVEKNVINYPCIAKSDGGGIYSWDQDGGITFINRRVKNNIIVNSGKFLYGTATPGLNTQGYGIYCDAGTSNVIMDSNVIGPSIYTSVAGGIASNCGTQSNATNTFDDGGIYLNGGINLTVRENIIYGWPNAIMYWRYGNVPNISNVRGIRIVKNAMYVNGGGTGLCTWNVSFKYHTYDCPPPPFVCCCTPAQSTLTDILTQIQNMGVIDSNYVSTFAPSPYMYKGDNTNPGQAISLATWRSRTGQSANDQGFPATTTPTLVINYGTTGGDTTIFFSGLSKKDYKGTVYNNQATVPMYYANIFFDNGTAPSAPLSITSTDTTQINCFGNTTTLTVNATGGTVPYTYRLNTGSYQSSNAFTGVSAGTYTVTVRDNTLATASVSRTIYEPTPLITDLPTSGSITTIGGTTTITQPVASGGSLNYVYNINGGTYQASNIFINRPAGTYTINVRDIRGCIVTKSITIVQPNAPLIISRPLIQN